MVGKWFAKRTSKIVLFLLSKYERYSVAEVVPGRIHARAIFEKVKIYFMNFLLIIFGHSRACRGDPFVVQGHARAGDLPGVRTGVSYDPVSWAPASVQELRAGPAAGPVPSIHKRAGSCGWKILPIPCSSYKLHFSFTICLQFIYISKLDFFQKI